MSKYKNIIDRFKNKKILVIGDLILDQHVSGSVSRISPEAPVPVVLQQGDPTFSPGGAANVANNLRSLGVDVVLVGRIGDDEEGRQFVKELKKKKISASGILKDKTIPTIVKTRIIAQHQQVLRLDREKLIPCDDALLNKIEALVRKNIDDLHAIIISDYGKGLITPKLVTAICTLAQTYKKIITVDPKDDHFNYYRQVTSITPNKKEAENAIRNIKITHNQGRRLALNSDRLNSIEDVKEAGNEILDYLKLESLLITLGEQGMCLFEKGKKPVQIHTRAKEVFDVTGAGDTVISVFTLALTSGASKLESADLANFAAGVVVGKRGAVAITKEELLNATKDSSQKDFSHEVIA
jgi:D-beta-D-heptose 7-phosphate kinase/D-beta-D-heptose 1-phosphate adenosyltransferase